MLKYILFACLIVLFVLNFTVGKIIKLITKKEVPEKTEMTAKGIVYVLALAVVILIMVYC